MKNRNNVLGIDFKSIIEDKDESEISDILETEEPQPVTEKVPSIERNPVEKDEISEKEKPSKIVIEDMEIFNSFIKESHDHLDNIEEKILKLEDSNDEMVLNEIFRSMHTIKGNSGFFGFENIKELSHLLENLLDHIRSKRKQIDADVTDVLLEGTDVLSEMIGEIEEKALQLSADTSGFSGKIAIPDVTYDREFFNLKISKIINSQPEEETERREEKISSGSNLVTGEILYQFVSESKELLNTVEKDFLELEKNNTNLSFLEDAFRNIHTIKGNAGFLGQEELEKTCINLENNLDSIRKGKREINSDIISILLNTIDSMQRVLDFIRDEEIEVKTETEYKPVGEILVEMGAVTDNDVDAALNLQDRKVGEILVSQGKVSEEVVDKALKSQKKILNHHDEKNITALERKDIRVDMWKLDKLFNLVGEIISAEAMISHNPQIEQLKIEHKKELESFNRATGYLGKITREMQEITMSMRMIPLEGTFNKMKRLVRDLSRKFNKKINLTISGQETEMDRSVIEKISDPLVHIIRNALDHGIEDSITRQKRGKPEIGNLYLAAKYEGNEIWITVRDDGAGLDREKILSKAIENDLIESTTENISDEDVWKLIFEPGFSTAERISEISGRGVGMDVVKKNIEEIKGKISIRSARGEGTEIILKIPLTLAIVDGITVKVGNSIYAIRLDDILEFHKASNEQITKTNTNREVLRLRESLIPIIRLDRFFGLPRTKEKIEDGILIVVKADTKKAAVLVDEIKGYQQVVIKSLPRYISDMRAISGCSVMGNGDICLVMDTGSLLKYELN